MTDQQSNNDTSQDQIIIQEKITKKNDEVIIRKYRRGKFLGRGGFASCYEVTDLETNRVMAVKIVAKSSLTKKRALEKLLSEIKIHKSLHHENIVQFEKVFEDKENVYIFLELCPNQTLKELIKSRKKVNEIECVVFITQTVNAIKYLHEKRIIHRDLKLGNLMLGKDYDVKVGDFGLAARMDLNGEKRRTICGTPNYIAPEVLDKKIGHSFEVDVWAIGVICYTLLIGKPPFETNDSKATYRRILKNNYSFPANVPISEEAKDLIKKILVLDPAMRPTLNEILQHPFIKNPSNKASNENAQNMTRDNTLQVIPNTFNPSLTDKAFQLHTREVGMDRSNYDTDALNALSPVSRKDIKSAASLTRPQLSEGRPRVLTNSGVSLKSGQQLEIKPNAVIDVHVSKWIDYSNKYGLGYLLSDGTSGVMFRDSTKLILSVDNLKLEYMQKKPNMTREILSTYSLTKYPEELNKKVLLLRHFKDYLEEKFDLDDSKDKANDREVNKEALSTARTENMVYVKRWFKSQKATLFKLSNKIVQVDFEDKTQILLDAKAQVVHYRNKKREYNQYNLQKALDLDYPEMVKRLKYAKEILIYMKELQEDPPIRESYTNNGQFDVDAAYTTRDGVTEKLPKANVYRVGMIRTGENGSWK